MGMDSFWQSALKTENDWLHALSYLLRKCLFLFFDVCDICFVTGLALNYTDRHSIGFSLRLEML